MSSVEQLIFNSVVCSQRKHLGLNDLNSKCFIPSFPGDQDATYLYQSGEE